MQSFPVMRPGARPGMAPGTGHRAGEIARLRAQIARIEQSSPGLSPPPAGGAAAAPDEIWPGLPLVAGILHEVRAHDWRSLPSAAGFALMLALRLRARRAEAGAVVIIEKAHEAVRDGGFYGPGLAALGADPAGMVFVRPRDNRGALWAAEEAALSADAAAVILMHRDGAPAFDLAASRRLHLAAGRGGATVFALRAVGAAQLNGRQGLASCAPWRWRVAPAQGAPDAFDARAPGAARWRVTVEKGGAAAQQEFLVEQRHDDTRLALVGPAAPPPSGRLRPSTASETDSRSCFSLSVYGSLPPPPSSGVAA